ncbi:MAG: hypothetical protein ACI9N0_001368 [Ilumatobacter sp.]|jgi:hypothetical protein
MGMLLNVEEIPAKDDPKTHCRCGNRHVADAFGRCALGYCSLMTSTINIETTDDLTEHLAGTSEKLTTRLDDLETSLPRVPSAALSFGRAATRRATAIATSAYDKVSPRFETIGSQVGTAVRTAAGQARSAAGRSINTLKNNASEATGQAKAQTAAVIGTIEDETVGLLDDAAKSVDPKTINPASLTDLSKDELYERAQAADIDGRSTMSKAQLVTALRSS